MFCTGLPVLVPYWLSVLAFGTGAVLAYVEHDNDFFKILKIFEHFKNKLSAKFDANKCSKFKSIYDFLLIIPYFLSILYI